MSNAQTLMQNKIYTDFCFTLLKHPWKIRVFISILLYRRFAVWATLRHTPPIAAIIAPTLIAICFIRRYNYDNNQLETNVSHTE